MTRLRRGAAHEPFSDEHRVIEADRVEDLAGRSFDEIEYQPFSAFDEKWTRYFIDACDARVLNALYGDERLVPFSDIALINVGVTTGDNSFFSLTDETSATYELDDLTLPLIGRSSHASGVFSLTKTGNKTEIKAKEPGCLHSKTVSTQI